MFIKMRYFIFLYLLLFHTNNVIAQMEIRVGKNTEPQIDNIQIKQEKEGCKISSK